MLFFSGVILKELGRLNTFVIPPIVIFAEKLPVAFPPVLLLINTGAEVTVDVLKPEKSNEAPVLNMVLPDITPDDKDTTPLL